ncbi:MAG: ribonuclease [Dehalococcoidia bacterium]|nr:ribonuclease [Dehalococcoidia bacterium]
MKWSGGESLVLYVDGSAKPNPGPARIGALLENDGGEKMKTLSRSIGWATNNEAEYRALLAGLEMAAAVSHKSNHLEVRSDSELMVRQLHGSYRVKKQNLMPLHRRAIELLRAFPSANIRHIPREMNKAHTVADGC